MNTRLFSPFRSVSLILSAGACLALVGVASAQLNETKIERDAAGVFTGGIKRGTFKSITDGTVNDTFSTTPYSGKIKVPVKDGALSTVLSDSDLPTNNDKAGLKGTEQRSAVQRGGKRVAAKAIGNVVTPGSPAWTNCSITGTIDDKGAKWTGNCEATGKKTFPAYLYDPDSDPGTDNSFLVPATTFIITGLDVDGKG